MRPVFLPLLALAGCSLMAPTSQNLVDAEGLTTTLLDAYPEFPLLDGVDLGEPLSFEAPGRDGRGPVQRKPGYYRRKVHTY